MNNLKLCALATSPGGVETIIQHSALTTNVKMPPKERLKIGITDGLDPSKRRNRIRCQDPYGFGKSAGANLNL